MKAKILTRVAITYFIIGFIFATAFAINYKWEVFSFMSPKFYLVVFSWPIQAPGFVYDISTYGFGGKTV